MDTTIKRTKRFQDIFHIANFGRYNDCPPALKLWINLLSLITKNVGSLNYFTGMAQPFWPCQKNKNIPSEPAIVAANYAAAMLDCHNFH